MMVHKRTKHFASEAGTWQAIYVVRVLSFLISIFLSLIFVQTISAQTPPAFVSVVNPIRGEDFWALKDQKPADAVAGQMEILNRYGISSTWLVRFDALKNKEIVSLLKQNKTYEIGLFLEVTPSWTEVSAVKYQELGAWHLAGSVFLTGYDPSDRRKLIDSAFEKFKDIFGFLPQSVGAWWIDSNSLSYMEKKYNVKAALIVADQFSTDRYQVWGQYFGTPFYPDKNNTIFPAQSVDRKIPVVVTQWAARDPINGYGEGVNETTYSVQANDYLEYHQLDTNYFSKLLDIYTKQSFNEFGQITVGLENSYQWSDFSKEYENQIAEIAKRLSRGQLRSVTMSEFSTWYKVNFSSVSPTHIISTDDPLGTDQKVIWFMNPFYRIGWFYSQDGASFRDIRQYVPGQNEICFDKSCQDLNLAKSATRVLDDITFKTKWILDKGKISDFSLQKNEEKYILNYKNEAGVYRVIEFLPRDLLIDDQMYTIDGAILHALSLPQEKMAYTISQGEVDNLKQLFDLIANFLKFLSFVIVAILIPGMVMTRPLNISPKVEWIFLSVCIGMVGLTLVVFIFGFLGMRWFVFVYLALTVALFLYKKIYLYFKYENLLKINWLLIFLIIAGVIFQSLAMIRSGWIYSFGVGFWGPIGHDGVWHQALINQLINQIPPANPVLSGNLLFNYHYFYDLLVAETVRLTQSSVLDNLYRFYPILLSVLLGVGTYLLCNKLFQERLAVFYSVFFVYFGSSFGWVVEFLRERHFGGESAFWANQPISMNLNPPFAVSLVLVISIILLFGIFKSTKNFFSALLLILVSGSLIEFKVYAGIVVLIALALISLKNLIYERKLALVGVFLSSLLLSLIVFLPQNRFSNQLLIFSPFWFIHSMIDLADRVGWQRLSLARQAYFARSEWIKFFLAEVLGFLIFIVGNLGTRVIGFFTLVKFKDIWRKDEYLLIALISMISLIMPIIFIQKGNPWNTIQFIYYFLFFAAVGGGLSLSWLQKKLPKKLGLTVVATFILITPISSISTFKSYLHPTPPSTLSLVELKALEFLKNLPDGFVLTYPYDKEMLKLYQAPFPLFVYETTSYVSAFSGKQTFVEDEFQHEILQNDYKKRLIGSTTFFSGRDKDWSREFLLSNNIKYIYLPKALAGDIELERLSLQKIFENAQVYIYQVK